VSKILEFTVAPGATERTFRVTKSVQHLLMRRTGTLAILAAGLLLGLPEKVSAEISHPVRKRVVGCDRIPLSHIAAFNQFGRGPIVETAPAAGLADALFGSIREGANASQQITTEVHYYISQDGPLEILSDDDFSITLTGLVVGATYTIFAPEQPVMPASASSYTNYERSLVLAGETQKDVYTADCIGMILPNRPDVLERLVMTFNMDGSSEKESEYPLDELLAVQADANPFVTVMNYTSPNVNARSSVSTSSGNADLLIMKFQHVNRIELHTVLGQQLEYTLVRNLDRNSQ
jgi:hypothetical protein